MTTCTELEKRVYNALIDLCTDQSDADCNDISTHTGLPINTVKGVVGSLVKKDLADVDEEKRGRKIFQTINPFVNGEYLSFGCDSYTEQELKSFYL